MIASIVACGESAKGWYKIPVHFSVGVNDCAKFGYEVDYLVCVNAPAKFNAKRTATMINSNPKKFFCHDSNWKTMFPKYELLQMRTFIGMYKKDRIYSSKTSPFVAITKAVELGATELIIWGVDMVSHHKFSAGKRDFNNELHNYQLLFEQLDSFGVKCWIGNENTVLKQFLPVVDPDRCLKNIQETHSRSKRFEINTK